MRLGEVLGLARSIKRAGPKRFTQHVVPHVVRPAQILWNKALGGLFLFFAVVFLYYAIKYYRTLATGAPNPVGLAFSVFLTIVMTGFGISSFRKASRLSRL